MKMNAKNFWVSYIAGLIIVVVYLCQPADAAENPVINYSTNANRSAPNVLDGQTLSGLVYITLPVPKSQRLTLSWWPNNDNVDGYTVYQGTTVGNVVKFGANVPHDESKFIVMPGLPMGFDTGLRVNVSYNDTEFTLDETFSACFRLKAYNTIAFSGYSDGVCTIIHSVKSVSFYLDDETMSGAPFNVEKSTPYDFVGSDISAAVPFDVDTLSDGQHIITALVELMGQEKTYNARGVFNVVKKLSTPTGVVVRSELVW